MFDTLNYIISFIFILSFIVFIHEYGHYIVAKKCGVRIESFSIGFGKELFGRNDKSGTRWKICVLPLGGYVKMFGDTNPASTPNNSVQKLTDKEKKETFFFKPLYQRALIVFAGPFANFLLAIVVLTAFLSIYGISKTTTEISQVSDNSPAYQAGLQANDLVLAIDGSATNEFSDLQQIVQISPNISLKFLIKRNEQELLINVMPQAKETNDIFGNKITIGFLGVSSTKVIHEKINPFFAFPLAIKKSYDMSALTLKALGQIITGKRSINDLSGPVKIAKYSGQVTKESYAQGNIALLLWFIAMISLNLGLVNLFPLPILDGGHLLFYAIEAVKGKPVSLKVQDRIHKVSFMFLLFLFTLITVNDIRSVIFS
jgi:regulator of sigma E protease